MRKATEGNRKEPKKVPTTRPGWFARALRSFVAADKKLQALVGIGLLAAVYGTVTHAPEALKWAYSTVFRYPVEVTYANQRETETGYVFELKVKSTDGSAVFISREDIEVRIIKDKRLVDAMSADDRNKLLYGESAKVFEDAAALEAEIDGRTYTTGGPTIAFTAQPRQLFLLLTVAGPGSANPSARLQLAAIYRSVVVDIRRRMRTSEYVEIPIKHVAIIAGDRKTRVIQK